MCCLRLCIFCSPQFDLTQSRHQNAPVTSDRPMQKLGLLESLILPVALVLMNLTLIQLFGFLGKSVLYGHDFEDQLQLVFKCIVSEF